MTSPIPRDSFPFRSFRPSLTLPTTPTLPSLTTLPIYPFVPVPIINTSPQNHLDEILQVDPEEEALRRPKKRRRTKRQRLLELQAQLDQHGDGSVECQQQAEQLLEQLNRPSGRKRRRIASELVDSEKWFCPYECGKFYRKTSTRSIFEHQVECRKKTLALRQQEKEKETNVIPLMTTFNPTLTPIFMQPTFPTFIPTVNIPTQTTFNSSTTLHPPTPTFNLPTPALALPTSTLNIPSTSTLPIPSMPLNSPFTRHLSMIRGLPFMPVSPLHLMRPIALTSR